MTVAAPDVNDSFMIKKQTKPDMSSSKLTICNPLHTTFSPLLIPHSLILIENIA